MTYLNINIINWIRCTTIN